MPSHQTVDETFLPNRHPDALQTTRNSQGKGGRVTLQTLSIRQPWAWLVVKGFKTFENRERIFISKTGPFWVHASLTPAENFEAICRMIEREYDIVLPKEFDFGAIIGQGAIIRAVYENAELTNAWRIGQSAGYLLDRNKARLLHQPQPCRGQISWFNAMVHDATFANENRMVADIPPVMPKAPIWS